MPDAGLQHGAGRSAPGRHPGQVPGREVAEAFPTAGAHLNSRRSQTQARRDAAAGRRRIMTRRWVAPRGFARRSARSFIAPSAEDPAERRTWSTTEGRMPGPSCSAPSRTRTQPQPVGYQQRAAHGVTEGLRSPFPPSMRPDPFFCFVGCASAFDDRIVRRCAPWGWCCTPPRSSFRCLGARRSVRRSEGGGGLATSSVPAAGGGKHRGDERSFGVRKIRDQPPALRFHTIKNECTAVWRQLREVASPAAPSQSFDERRLTADTKLDQKVTTRHSCYLSGAGTGSTMTPRSVPGAVASGYCWSEPQQKHGLPGAGGGACGRKRRPAVNRKPHAGIREMAPAVAAVARPFWYPS